MKKHLLAAAVLAAVSFGASADTKSYTDTQIDALLTSNNNRTDWNSAFVIPYFDTTLGTLNSVSITLDGNVSTLFSITSTQTNARTTSANSAADIAVAALGLTVSSTGSQSVSVPGGATVAVGPVLGTGSQTVAGIVADWIGSGNRSLGVSAFGNSGTQGGGNLNTSVQTWANATLTVIYDYTKPSTNVPEPASMALVGLGLAGLSVLRRRK